MNVLRVYLDPASIGDDGYPHAWHQIPEPGVVVEYGDYSFKRIGIKDIVRLHAGHRCVRCGHPYPPGIAETHPRGEWTPCDETCYSNDRHPFGEPLTRTRYEYDGESGEAIEIIEAQWRILTVHHLNGIKHDCRWWNLVALCQRCHLVIQGRVVMERVYPLEHSDWFKPYAAGWYAWAYQGRELTRAEVMEEMEELLSLERID